MDHSKPFPNPVSRNLVLAVATAMALQILAGCVPLAIGTATVTGIDLYTERRTVGQNVDDNTLELSLRKDIALDDNLDGTNVSVTAINGIVLLTGEVHTDAQRQYTEKLARSFVDTREVVNELELSGKTNITSRANDSYITGKVKSKLIAAGDVPSTNIKVVTERGKVYLLGLVTHSEADAAVRETKTVSGVTHIVKVFEYIDT